MGTNRQPGSTVDLRGMVVPLAHTLGATMTATSQAGPKPGGFVPSTVTKMALHSSGELDSSGSVAAGSQMTLTTYRAGGVGTATIRWRFTSESGLYSWDAPVALSGWEFVDRSTTANAWSKPHAIRNPSTGRLHVVATQASGGITDTIVVWNQDQFGKWSSVTIEDTGDETCGTLVALPSGRLVCLYVYTVATDKAQIRMAFSDDSGTTWTAGQTQCLETPLAQDGDNYVRIRAAYANGKILLLLHEAATNDAIRQYVSSDEGCTFQSVETFSSSTKGYPDIAVYNGTFYVAYLEYDATGVDVEPVVHTLASAAQPLSSTTGVDAGATSGDSEWGTYAAGLFTSGDCAICVDDDGVLWLYGRDHATGAGAYYETLTRLSLDLNQDWTSNSGNMHNAIGSVVHWSGDTATYIWDFCAVAERGRIALFHRMEANPATHDDSLCALYLGGWSSVGMFEEDSYAARTGFGAWHIVWLPLDLPQNTGTTWTQTPDPYAGSQTATLSSTGMTLTAGAGESNNFTATPASTTVADGVMAEFHVTVGEGDWKHAVRISDGAADFEASVTANATGLSLDDENGGNIATATVDCTKGVVIRIAVDKPSGVWAGANGRVRAWYRVDGPYQGGAVNYGPRAVRRWTSIGTSSALTNGAETTARVYFGITGATASDQATYRYVAFAGSPFHGGSVTPDNGIASSVSGYARGRTIPPASSPVHVAEGLRLHGENGPSMAGDTWTHDTAFEFPVTNLDPSRAPSPSMPWRATSDAVDQDIVWSGIDLGWRTGDILAVYVAGNNAPTMTLYRDSGGANKVMDMSFLVSDLDFTRSRDTLIPAAGGTSPPFFFHEGQLKGCYADLGSGDIRKIKWNTAGSWLASGAPGTYPSARIILESYDSGDAASGTMAIRMSAGFFFVESLQATDTLMLRIPAADTAENYLTLGTVLIGRLRIMQQWSRGRGMLFTPLYDLTTLPSGGRIGRGRGVWRPAVEIDWAEGVVTTGLHTFGSAPSWYTLGYTGADAIAAPAATSRTLAGIIREVEGATVPVVLVHGIAQLNAATTTTAPYSNWNPEAVTYGRIVTETLRVDSRPDVRGAELRDPSEVVQIGRVVVEAEV
jgi:hypothetical protein